MPSERNEKLVFIDILEAIKAIRSYSEGISYSRFIKDKMRMDAIVKNLMVIGEAVKNVPPDIKRNYKNVDWRAIAGMRDKLIHGYFGISMAILWKTIGEDLPGLEAAMKDILKKR